MKQYSPGDVVWIVGNANLTAGEDDPTVYGPYVVKEQLGECKYFLFNADRTRAFICYLDSMYESAEDAGEAAMNWR